MIATTTINPEISLPPRKRLPDHWVLRPLKSVTRCLDGRRVPVAAEHRTGGPYPYYGANGIVDWVDDYLFDEPLVLLGEDGAPFFDRNASVAYYVEGKVWVNNHSHVLRATGVDPRFLVYVLNATDYALHVTGSTRDKLTQADMASIPVPLPPLPEQGAIAAFLSRETARIDALVTEMRRLRAAYSERRDACIFTAITGRSSGVAMKGTRVSWIDAVPVDWEVAPLYSRYSVQLGKMLDGRRSAGDHLAPYLRNVNVQWDRIDTDELFEMDFDATDREKYALERGDLLVCEGGEVGRAALWQGELPDCYYQKALHRLRATRVGENSRFLMYVLQAAASIGVFVAQGNSNTIDHLTAEKLRRHRFPFPPPEEQTRIVKKIDTEVGLLRTLDRGVERRVDLLLERREALITAAVTGQLGIAEAAA